MRKYRKWREIVIEQLAANWDEALDYIQFAMEEYQVDGDTEVFLLALYTFVESQGGVAEVAKRTSMDPQTLSKILSSQEVPHFDTFVAILKALGCRLSIEPLNDKETIPDIELAINTESPQLSNEETQLSESD
ncbi:helix-turn-helix domain-containing protein [Candidatus Poribacteria bacterium]|nr:helix-turn-helix domain-containing protein [Candidatus Poribacteria bacterium]MYG05602.1 helix-turn-helix domain-containing protein [Candidatus Poribacteria bacterium]MYK23885.1 helix-turn-helix domain-containing protein [Candidatus Poribacteria bacterium]